MNMYWIIDIIYRSFIDCRWSKDQYELPQRLSNGLVQGLGKLCNSALLDLCESCYQRYFPKLRTYVELSVPIFVKVGSCWWVFSACQETPSDLSILEQVRKFTRHIVSSSVFEYGCGLVIFLYFDSSIAGCSDCSDATEPTWTNQWCGFGLRGYPGPCHSGIWLPSALKLNYLWKAMNTTTHFGSLELKGCFYAFTALKLSSVLSVLVGSSCLMFGLSWI